MDDILSYIFSTVIIGIGIGIGIQLLYLVHPTFKSWRFSKNFRGIKITIKKGSNSPFDLLIQDDDPHHLLKIVKENPVEFIMSYGYVNIILDKDRNIVKDLDDKIVRDTAGYFITDIEAYDNCERVQDMYLMYKIANHMKLDVTTCQNIKELDQLVKDHIKYLPPPEINTGYYDAEKDHSEIAEKYIIKPNEVQAEKKLIKNSTDN